MNVKVTKYVCCPLCWQRCEYDLPTDRHVCPKHGPIVSGECERRNIKGGNPCPH